MKFPRELMEWVDDLAVDLEWSRSQVMVTLLGLVRAAGVMVVDVGDVPDNEDIVGGVVITAGVAPVDTDVLEAYGAPVVAADRDARSEGGLVTGDESDDELFSEADRRRMIQNMYNMGMGRGGSTKISDSARVRAGETWLNMGSEHWELRSKADDDDIVTELLSRLSITDLHDLLHQASELRDPEPVT